jgi:RND family efflux transporter MFP subunit
VSAVDNRIDPESRTLQVQATLPNGDGTIRPGMSFSVSMSFPGQTFAAVDPLSIQWSNEGAYVWKVTDGKVGKGMVEIVQRNSDGVLVNGDVKPGDMVVTQGVLQLQDGLAVRLLDEG